jgi:hypothetical protein
MSRTYLRKPTLEEWMKVLNTLALLLLSLQDLGKYEMPCVVLQCGCWSWTWGGWGQASVLIGAIHSKSNQKRTNSLTSNSWGLSSFSKFENSFRQFSIEGQKSHVLNVLLSRPVRFEPARMQFQRCYLGSAWKGDASDLGSSRFALYGSIAGLALGARKHVFATCGAR